MTSYYFRARNYLSEKYNSWRDRRDAEEATAQFEVYMYEGEYRQIEDWVLRKENIETGGDLFGLWIDPHKAVVQFVLGPGQKCKRSDVSFYQDISYLSNVGEYLLRYHGLCNIGQWHSHHRLKLDKPSAGDEQTVWNNLPELNLNSYIVFIATIKDGRDGRPAVDVNCFLFKLDVNGSRLPVMQGQFKKIKKNSPMRLNYEVFYCSSYEAESVNSITISPDEKISLVQQKALTNYSDNWEGNIKNGSSNARSSGSRMDDLERNAYCKELENINEQPKVLNQDERKEGWKEKEGEKEEKEEKMGKKEEEKIREGKEEEKEERKEEEKEEEKEECEKEKEEEQQRTEEEDDGKDDGKKEGNEDKIKEEEEMEEEKEVGEEEGREEDEGEEGKEDGKEGKEEEQQGMGEGNEEGKGEQQEGVGMEEKGEKEQQEEEEQDEDREREKEQVKCKTGKERKCEPNKDTLNNVDAIETESREMQLAEQKKKEITLLHKYTNSNTNVKFEDGKGTKDERKDGKTTSDNKSNENEDAKPGNITPVELRVKELFGSVNTNVNCEDGKGTKDERKDGKMTSGNKSIYENGEAKPENITSVELHVKDLFGSVTTNMNFDESRSTTNENEDDRATKKNGETAKPKVEDNPENISSLEPDVEAMPEAMNVEMNLDGIRGSQSQKANIGNGDKSRDQAGKLENIKWFELRRVDDVAECVKMKWQPAALMET